MPEIWAIIPIKRLEHAKSRLAGLLDRPQRAELALAMYRDVLDMLGGVKRLSGILVVTNDREAADLARRAGATVLPDPVERGTNRAVEAGLSWLLRQTASRALIIPGDVPFTTREEVDSVIDALSMDQVVIVPAAQDGGTNMLGLAAPDTMGVSFGEDSFRKHRTAAQRSGLEPRILHLDGAGHDIDVSADLFCTEGGAPAARTRAILQRLERAGPVQSVVSFKEMCSHE